MDFVERIFGIAPDGGSGYFELSLLFAAVMIPVLIANGKRKARGRQHRERR